MKLEYYANVYRQYATFMTDWKNSDGLIPHCIRRIG